MNASILCRFTQGIVGIDAVILEFAIESRAPDSQFARHLAHLAAVEFQGKPNQFLLDLGELPDLAAFAEAGDGVLQTAFRGLLGMRRLFPRAGIGLGGGELTGGGTTFRAGFPQERPERSATM